MTNRVFIIADTHFGHKNIIDFEKDARPFATIEEHDEALVDRWNSAVNKNDTVWHLGDVLFGEASFKTLGRLNGVKKLVMGNHDHYPMAKYLEHFSQVFGAVKYRDCIMTHVPVHPNQFGRFQTNIHGHLHSLVVLESPSYDYAMRPVLEDIPDIRYICVSAEQINLTPILFDTLLETRLQVSAQVER